MVDKHGNVTGVEFNHDGNFYQQKAKVVIVSAFAVESPRLLLNSACPQYPDGLANSSGMVGKCIMPHSGQDVFAKFDDEIRLYKGTPVLACTQDFYETDESRGFVMAIAARTAEYLADMMKKGTLRKGESSHELAVAGIR